MLTPAQQTRLIALEAVMDARLFGRNDDEDGPGMLGTAAQVAGVGAAGYAGYKGVQAVSDKMDLLSQAKKAGGMGRAYTGMGNLPSLDAAGKVLPGKLATATGAVGRDIWGYLRKQGGRLATKVGLQSMQRLTTLSAKLEEFEIQHVAYEGGEGGYALHKVTGPFKGHASGYFDKTGKLVDAEHLLKPGGASGYIKPGASMWNHLQMVGKRFHGMTPALKRVPA